VSFVTSSTDDDDDDDDDQPGSADSITGGVFVTFIINFCMILSSKRLFDQRNGFFGDSYTGSSGFS